jgi:hypothetical protein
MPASISPMANTLRNRRIKVPGVRGGDALML